MKITKYFIFLLLLQLSLHSLVYADSISVYFDSAVPQHEFAANDIKAALEDDGDAVAFKELSSLDTSSLEKKIVIALV